ncbi:MAG TPA: hypothetical protein VHZ31_09955 [Solirubrobacteraceae bacterium]|nr:hypothetical protein [Solirubrobacteraceae bacterium]
MAAGLLAPSGAVAKTRSHRAATTNPIITRTTGEIQQAVATAVACVREAVGDGGSNSPTTTTASVDDTVSPAVIACVRTALRSMRTIIDNAIDALQGTGEQRPEVAAAFAQLRAAVAAAFDKIDAELGSAS